MPIVRGGQTRWSIFTLCIAANSIVGGVKAVREIHRNLERGKHQTGCWMLNTLHCIWLCWASLSVRFPEERNRKDFHQTWCMLCEKHWTKLGSTGQMIELDETLHCCCPIHILYWGEVKRSTILLHTVLAHGIQTPPACDMYPTLPIKVLQFFNQEHLYLAAWAAKGHVGRP